MRKGFLVVSIGGNRLQRKNHVLDRMKEWIQEHFNEYRVYEAFLCNVAGTLKQMLQEGVEEIVIQPLFLLHGLEYEKLGRQAMEYREQFGSIRMGIPLLTEGEDLEVFVEQLMDSMPRLQRGEAIVLMGHGTEHESNAIYVAVNTLLKRKGHIHVHVGTMKSMPTLCEVVKELSKHTYQKVYLIPLFLQVGVHVVVDMIEKEDSWSNVLTTKGYEVVPIARGLCEYEFVSTMFVGHLLKTLVLEKEQNVTERGPIMNDALLNHQS